jgi:hypothetical protein
MAERRNCGQRNDGDARHEEGVLNETLTFAITNQFAKHEITFRGKKNHNAIQESSTRPVLGHIIEAVSPPPRLRRGAAV